MNTRHPTAVLEDAPLDDGIDVRVEPPAELWGLVVAATVHRRRLRRQLLRSLRPPLVLAALVLVVLSSATTAWVVTRLTSIGSREGVQVAPALRADADLDRMLAARDHDHGPIARERVDELRRRLATMDDALRRAPDDEALYAALAQREHVLKELTSVLGIGPRAPRAPLPPRPTPPTR